MRSGAFQPTFFRCMAVIASRILKYTVCAGSNYTTLVYSCQLFAGAYFPKSAVTFFSISRMGS